MPVRTLCRLPKCPIRLQPVQVATRSPSLMTVRGRAPSVGLADQLTALIAIQPAGDHVHLKPWVQKVLKEPVSTAPAAASPGLAGGGAGAAQASRRRPFIYVYDLPPQLHSDVLQYRWAGETCSWLRGHWGLRGHWKANEECRGRRLC